MFKNSGAFAPVFTHGIGGRVLKVVFAKNVNTHFTFCVSVLFFVHNRFFGGCG
jgi:hypothetical protein